MPDAQTPHRRSIRLPRYDYAQPRAYFVTIVTAGRLALFGQIEEGAMQLSDLGRVVRDQWCRLPKRFPGLELGAVVVMPNHVHGILIIHAGRGTAENLLDLDEGASRRARTTEDLPDLDEGSSRRAPTEQFGKPVPGSIPTIIRSFKAAVAFRIHRMRGNDGLCVWQRNYYEHVIRNERDWDRIHRYIEANPRRWTEDRENPQLWASQGN